MRTVVAACALLMVIVAGQTSANGTLAEACCACASLTAGAHTAAIGNPIEALFCAEASTDETEPLTERCVALDRTAKLLCVANIPGPSCRQQLLEQNSIECPGVRAPVVAAPALAALALAMSALGAWAIRRRSRG